MNNHITDARPVPVPAGRLARMAQLGGMTASVAGNMALNGIAQSLQGQRPALRDLLLTPRNMSKVAEQLARMRGAAMKVGQLVSMDTGDMLPPELAQIMARLRADAHFMPPKQLREVLAAGWPKDWHRAFRRFDVRPIAAASIGQVHRATLRDGRELAIKVQYPGVARSIDSDVANVGVLIRASGLVPKGFDLAPYLEEARAQLHEETDYAREAAHLTRFGALLAGDDRYVVPAFHSDWSTGSVLSMGFVDGRPIEDVAELDAQTRTRVAHDLIALTLRELFDFAEMLTDPNFANYRYDPATGRIVLLDFGAARGFDAGLIDRYRALLQAGLAHNLEATCDAAQALGFFRADEPAPHMQRIRHMVGLALDDLHKAEAYDFTDMTVSRAMQTEGLALAQDGFVPPLVPMDVLYIQRKLAGMFLLAGRLKVQLPLLDMLRRAVET